MKKQQNVVIFPNLLSRPFCQHAMEVGMDTSRFLSVIDWYFEEFASPEGCVVHVI